MLSRTANDLFWMSRQMERAENTARTLDVTYRMSLLPYRVMEREEKWADPWALPLIINGLRCIDTKTLSNSIRFHDCLFVGSIVSDMPTYFTHARNKLQFTGATRFVQTNPNGFFYSLDQGSTWTPICGPPNSFDTRFYSKTRGQTPNQPKADTGVCPHQLSSLK